ncbi:MAG: tRNA-dihydrouridine synthase [Candidatus Paceibacterota bacterium]
MNNFWQQLKQPFFVLAPMADVTDAAFRAMIAKYSRPAGPAVFYTEFVSADGLCHPAAREKLKRELYFTSAERPIVAQIFSGRPERIKAAAALVAELGFDGLDINLGCPDRSVEKQLAGAGLIKHPTLAKEIISAAGEGAPDLPLSLKTRIGYTRTDELASWAETLLSLRPAAIAFHLRTRKEMSKVPAHWDLIKLPLDLARGTDTIIIGNGDVSNVAEARAKAEHYRVPGIMIGRGIFGRPWLFAETQPTVTERLGICREHISLFAELYQSGVTNDRLFAGHTKSFHLMKKHFKAYLQGFAGAPALRAAMMLCDSPPAAMAVLDNFLATGEN